MALNDIDKVGSEGGHTVKVGPIFLKGVFRTLFYKLGESQPNLPDGDVTTLRLAPGPRRDVIDAVDGSAEAAGGRVEVAAEGVDLIRKYPNGKQRTLVFT